MTNSDQARRRMAMTVGCSLAALVLSGALAVPAAAQTAATPVAGAAGQDAAPSNRADLQQPRPESQGDGDGQDVVVTGSRVARSGFQSPAPLTVLTQAEIQNQSPSNNIADFVNQQPALAGSTRPSNSRLNLSSGQAGINALNLRNLGEIRTLVLVDGHRSVGSTITGLVDVNTIPQGLVKSVEVVTGGASAAYGSDAVAGVVNFILDKKFDGFRVTADQGITQYGDGHNYSATLTAGTGFADGRGHIEVEGEYAHRDGIFQVDRDWNATGYVRIQDPNWTANSTTPQFITTQRQIGAANSAPGGLITGSTAVAGSGIAANSLRGVYFGGGGQPQQFQYGGLTFPSATGSAAPTLTQGGSWQVNDSGRNIGLDPQDDRYGVFGRVSYDVADQVEVYAEASYNRQHILFNAGPNLQTGLTIAATNPYLVAALGASRLAGISSVTLATTSFDLPYRIVDNRRAVQRYQIGADGKFDVFGKSVAWDVYGQYGRADLREQLRNVQNIARIANATAAAVAPAGNAGGYAAGSIQCAINVDANAANNDQACVPLNRLGIGVADPAAVAYVLGAPYRDETTEQKTAGLNLRASPFRTWAGDVSIAIGGEWREESIRGYVPQQFQPVSTVNAQGRPTVTNTWSVGNYLPTNGRYNVKEAYLETVVPLGLGLEFNGAVRGTDYSTSGSVATWKLGGTWQPIPDIRFRVVRSRDIRAPNLNELYQAGSANSDAVRNPLFTADGTNGPATYNYSGIATGNPNLKPEVANSWTIGAVLSPRFLKGFNASIDYWRINIKQGITSFAAQDIENLCSQGQQTFCDAITQDPARSSPGQPYLLIRTQPFNAANQLARGIDFDTSYRLPLSSQTALTLRGEATRYLDNILDTGVPGTVITNTVGVNGGQATTPTWIFRGSATLDLPTTSITVVGRGVSAGKYVATGIECQTSCPLSTITYPTYDNNQISGLFYADLNVTQNVTVANKVQAQFFVNVTNVFNRAPMLVPETGLAANSTYSDLLGRAFRVGIRVQTR